MKKLAIKLLVTSIALITISDLLRDVNVISIMVARITWVLSIITFVFTFIYLLSDACEKYKAFRIIFWLFLSYSIILIIRGFSSPTIDITSTFRESHVFWSYIIPLAVFFDKRLFSIILLFRIIYIFGIIFLVIAIVYPQALFDLLISPRIISVFAIGCGFLLMNARYFNNRRAFIAFIVLIIALLNYIYLARRSATFTVGSLIMASYFLNFGDKSKKIIFKLFPVIIVVTGTIFYLDSSSSALKKRMNERLFEDTRTELYDTFFLQSDEFFFFGKGMNGTYYYPMDESVQEDGVVFNDVVYRNVIENGYLQLLLTGGVINIVLFLSVLLPGAIIGIFKSKNQFTKSCGLIVFLWLIDMFFYGMPGLSIHYLIVWISVGVCYTPDIIKKSDRQLIQEFDEYKFGS